MCKACWLQSDRDFSDLLWKQWKKITSWSSEIKNVTTEMLGGLPFCVCVVRKQTAYQAEKVAPMCVRWIIFYFVMVICFKDSSLCLYVCMRVCVCLCEFSAHIHTHKGDKPVVCDLLYTVYWCKEHHYNYLLIFL